jgi:hypothetical protein
MSKALMRAVAPLAVAGGLALAAAGAAAAYPGTDDGLFPQPEPPIFIEPGGPDMGIFPPPEPPIRLP